MNPIAEEIVQHHVLWGALTIIHCWVP